jgi:rare lipoprotein A (peptidoglycan hydrolase)
MLDLSHAAARELGMVEAGTTAVYIEVTGDHHVVAPLPAGRTFIVAGSMLTEDVRPSRPNRVAQGLEGRDGPLRLMPQEALYVRRERRIGSILAADHTAHNTVPVLIVS